MDFVSVFLYGCGLVVGSIIMFTVLYFVIKAGVRDGVAEAKKAAEKKA